MSTSELRDRIKSRKFDEIFASFPEYVQKAYKELKGRAAITHFINSAIVRTEKHELVPNLVFFKHVTKRMLVKSNKELSRGLIFEEACTRAGGPASLEQAVKRGAVKCMTLKGLDLYFFPIIEISSEGQFMEEAHQEKLKQGPEVKGLADAEMGFEWGHGLETDKADSSAGGRRPVLALAGADVPGVPPDDEDPKRPNSPISDATVLARKCNFRRVILKIVSFL